MSRDLCLGLLVFAALLTVTPSGAVAGTYSFSNFDPPFPGVELTSPQGINSSGQVVGFYNAAGASSQGFFYSGGTFSNFNAPGAPSGITDPVGINDNGDIVGRCSVCGSPYFLYSGGSFTALERSPNGINDNGKIVGSYVDATGTHGFLYSGGSYTTIDVPLPGVDTTVPLGINEKDQIVGTYGNNHTLDLSHGFLYSQGTFITIDVPSLGGFRPYGINDSGQIAGSIQNHIFVYSGGSFSELKLPIPNIFSTEAYAINDRGQIVGYYAATDNAGNITAHGFLATPVPGPGSIILLCLGLAGVAVAYCTRELADQQRQSPDWRDPFDRHVEHQRH